MAGIRVARLGGGHPRPAPSGWVGDRLKPTTGLLPSGVRIPTRRRDAVPCRRWVERMIALPAPPGRRYRRTGRPAPGGGLPALPVTEWLEVESATGPRRPSGHRAVTGTERDRTSHLGGGKTAGQAVACPAGFEPATVGIEVGRHHGQPATLDIARCRSVPLGTATGGSRRHSVTAAVSPFRNIRANNERTRSGTAQVRILHGVRPRSAPPATHLTPA